MSVAFLLIHVVSGLAPSQVHQQYSERGIYITSKARMVSIPERGRGFRAIEKIKRGEKVISLPWDRCLWWASEDAGPPHASVLENFDVDWEPLGQGERLSFELAAAWLRRDPKIALPTARLHKALPIHWSNDDLKALETPALVEKIHKRRRKRRELLATAKSDQARLALDHAFDAVASRAFKTQSRKFSKILSAIGLATSLLFPALVLLPTFDNASPLNDPTTLSAVLATQLFALLVTAVASDRDDMAIVPGVCQLNTGGPKPTDSSARLFSLPFADQVQVRAQRDLDVGDELTITYGPRSNDDFLLDFGCVFTDNPFDRRNLPSSSSSSSEEEDVVVSRYGKTTSKVDAAVLRDDLNRLRRGAEPSDGPRNCTVARTFCREQARLLDELDKKLA